MLPAILNFWPAIAAGAIAIPVIIHLINRRRFKIVHWAAMKFLLAAQKQTRKRMRIEQLLLLLVRMMILALILFAMVSVLPWAEEIWAGIPFLQDFGKSVKSRPHRMHHVFVLDASLSMNQKVEGQSAFERARQNILKKIEDNPAGDGYSVLLLKDSPTWLVGEASQDWKRVKKEILDVKPSHGNGAVSSALSMISAKLSETGNRFPVQAVYFFTDLQKATWTPIASDLKTESEGKERNVFLEIKDKAGCAIVDVGPIKSSDNLAITEISFDLSESPYITAGSKLRIKAKIRNFGSEAQTNLRPELLIGKAKEAAGDTSMQMRATSQEKIDRIEAFADKEVVFQNVTFPTKGTYAVQVRIPGDALEEDNARAIIITVRETIPVLLVNGKPSTDRFEQATEYLKIVLNPFKPGEENKRFPLRPTVVTPTQFADMPESELETKDCIFWCDVGDFGEKGVRRMDAHLRRGGGFIIGMGDRAAQKIDDYNRLLYNDNQGILPAKLVKKVKAPTGVNFFLQALSYDSPPLLAFSEQADQRALNNAKFREYVQSVVPDGKARTVMSFIAENINPDKTKVDPSIPQSAPAIIEWNPPLSRAHQPIVPTAKVGKRTERPLSRYRGMVVLVTSALNMDWSSWPGSPSYGAMMHELTQLSVAGKLREQSQPVGGILEAFLAGSTDVEVKVHFPAGLTDMKTVTEQSQVIDEVNLFRWADTDFAGIYRFETKGQEIPFAVNVPANTIDLKSSESDLSRADERSIGEMYPGWNLKVVRDVLDAPVLQGPVNDEADVVALPVGPNLANIALLIVLALLFLEIVLAWHFGHYTTTEGALSQATSGATSTLLAAGIAILSTVFFLIGAGIVLHEVRTGDFLGFLPDILRTWFEQMVGVPALQAGEGSSWQYERSSFLFGLPGSENWYAFFITVGAIVTIFFTYRAEAPRVSLVYKLLLGALRFYLIFMVLWFILPRPQLQYARQGWPDMVLLIDDSRSMGEPDTFQDSAVADRVNKLKAAITSRFDKELPDRIKSLEKQIADRGDGAQTDPDVKAEVESLQTRLQYWRKQQDDLTQGKWRPSRLQLVQAILAQPEPHWLKSLLQKQTKVHIFHLDINGRATKLRDLKGDAGELIDPTDLAQMERASAALANLEPVGNASRLGSAVRQVIDHYRGAALSSIVMFTDGVTTNDETLSQAAEYAKARSVSLFLIGVGDDHSQRDLKLHDLSVADEIFLGDYANFETRLSANGFKDEVVPVILKYKDKNGEFKEIRRIQQKLADGVVKIKLNDQPTEIGRKHYVIEVVPPKQQPGEKPIPPSNLRQEAFVDVKEVKEIKVLYVEWQPRYEFRYIKFFMEREMPNEKQKKSIDLTVLLLDADDGWAARDRRDDQGVDKTAISNFPATLDDLNQYDVLIMGDCDPNHKKLKNSLKDIKRFVMGLDANDKKAKKAGGGILFIAGAFNSPHRYKGTPLADILPVEPLQDNPPSEIPRPDGFRPGLTPAGADNQIFKFSPDPAEAMRIWSKLQPLHWSSSRYALKPGADVLAVHPHENAEVQQGNNPSGKLPLVVYSRAGDGRSMFFGFDETWRWRIKEDEPKFNNFWTQTIRFLTQGRLTRTRLTLNKQDAYKLGEEIKVTVRFPESMPGDGKGPKITDKTEVKVSVTYTPPDADKGSKETDRFEIPLSKVGEGGGTFEGNWTRTRPGKYRFRLTHPDVSALQPDREIPTAEAIVIAPPGELEKLQINREEMQIAAMKTDGQFYRIHDCDKVLQDLPPGETTPRSSLVPPTRIWNQWWVFVLVVLLVSSEWVLRKMQHLL